MRVLKYWNRNHPFRQSIQAPTWLGVGRTAYWSPVISPPSVPPPLSTPNYAIPFYAIPTPNSLPFIIVMTSKLFCIILRYLYVAIEVLCGPLLPLNILIIIAVQIVFAAIFRQRGAATHDWVPLCWNYILYFIYFYWLMVGMATRANNNQIQGAGIGR